MGIFLGGRPVHLMLRLDSNLFIYLKVIWVYSSKATDAGSSSDALTSWIDSLTNLLVTMLPWKLPSDIQTHLWPHKDLVLCT